MDFKNSVYGELFDKETKMQIAKHHLWILQMQLMAILDFMDNKESDAECRVDDIDYMESLIKKRLVYKETEKAAK